MKKDKKNQQPKARRDTEFAGSLTPEVDGGACSARHEARMAARQLKNDANEKPGHRQ